MVEMAKRIFREKHILSDWLLRKIKIKEKNGQILFSASVWGWIYDRGSSTLRRPVSERTTAKRFRKTEAISGNW